MERLNTVRRQPHMPYWNLNLIVNVLPLGWKTLLCVYVCAWMYLCVCIHILTYTSLCNAREDFQEKECRDI